jgi:hypothetical protein
MRFPGQSRRPQQTDALHHRSAEENPSPDADRPPSRLKPLAFTAFLPAAFRPALEALFFFNPRQAASRHGITAIVEQTGTPVIMQSGDRIWIGVPSSDTQCLCACEVEGTEQRLVGVVLYCRPSIEVISILHLAVIPSRTGRHCVGFGCDLVERVRDISCRIKGVTRMRLPYRKDRFLTVRRPDGIRIDGNAIGFQPAAASGPSVRA